jgi:hypothetical protein
LNSTFGRAHDFVELHDIDKQRMTPLYEEVQARLMEMALIVSRNLGMEVSAHTKLMLRPVDVQVDRILARDEATVSSNGVVEVHCTETSPGHFECGCYDYKAGTCGPC